MFSSQILLSKSEKKHSLWFVKYLIQILQYLYKGKWEHKKTWLQVSVKE